MILVHSFFFFSTLFRVMIPICGCLEFGEFKNLFFKLILFARTFGNQCSCIAQTQFPSVPRFLSKIKPLLFALTRITLLKDRQNEELWLLSIILLLMSDQIVMMRSTCLSFPSTNLSLLRVRRTIIENSVSELRIYRFVGPHTAIRHSC